MALEDEISETFFKNEWTWSIKGGTFIPGPDDIQDALDEATRLLYTEPVGTQLEVGRLIIVKTDRTHDVYVYAGEYL